MSKDEAESIVDSILNFYTLTEEEKNATDFVAEIIIKASDKEELFLSLMKTIRHWDLYVTHFEQLEEYELCAKILRVIDYEILEFIIMANKYFSITDEDINYISRINDELRQQIQRK